MTQPVSGGDVREMHAIFADRFNARDLDGLMALYEPDAVLIPGPEPVRGPEAIRAALQGFLDLGGKISIRTTGVFESAGIALMHGEWSLNGGSTELAGKTAEVLRRQPDGRWLYVVDNPWV